MQLEHDASQRSKSLFCILGFVLFGSTSFDFLSTFMPNFFTTNNYALLIVICGFSYAFGYIIVPNSIRYVTHFNIGGKMAIHLLVSFCIMFFVCMSTENSHILAPITLGLWALFFGVVPFIFENKTWIISCLKEIGVRLKLYLT